ncbi:hypothetical protein ACLOAV_004484 [Pseudogymnoascus australis]
MLRNGTSTVKQHSSSTERNKRSYTGSDFPQRHDAVFRGYIPKDLYVQPRTDSQPQTMSHEELMAFAEGHPELECDTYKVGGDVQSRPIGLHVPPGANLHQQTMGQDAAFTEWTQGHLAKSFLQSQTDKAFLGIEGQIKGIYVPPVQTQTMNQEEFMAFAQGQPDVVCDTDVFGYYAQGRQTAFAFKEAHGQPDDVCDTDVFGYYAEGRQTAFAFNEAYGQPDDVCDTDVFGYYAQGRQTAFEFAEAQVQ